MNSKQNLTFLEIVRPISGADEFLTRSRALAEHIFKVGDDFTLMQITDEHITGDQRPVVVSAPYQICRVYNAADSIRLPLLERKTVPETRSGSSFNNAARILSNGRIKKIKSPNSAGLPLPYDIEPLKKQLFKVQLEHDFPDANKVPVTVDKIDNRFSFESLGGDIELVLLPKLDDEASIMLRAQSVKCAQGLVGISRKVAYPNGYHRLEIPFARVSKNANAKQLGKFIQSLSTLMPLHLNAGEPRITSQTSS